ncbi:MAG: hypothetical protein LBU72_08595 [Burkholderiaceae bacterium]|jgi:hypothetical protein|nr:hypothetical protein [Burkholderiaceae bacterium]
MSNIRKSQVASRKSQVASRKSQVASRKFCAVLGTIGLTLLGAGAVQAAPSAQGAIHAVTGMAHANYHATINCGNNVQVMTPQPGTDLMPIDVDTSVSPGIEAMYARAARQHVRWLDTVECGTSTKTHITQGMWNWSGYQIGGGSATSNQYVQSGWYMPTVAVPPSAYPPPLPANNWGLNGSDVAYDVAIWSGLGGGINTTTDYNQPLIQAGTDQEIHPDGTSTAYFWWEVVPESSTSVGTEKPILSIPVKPGDEAAGGAFWVPGSKAAVLGVCNFTINECVNINVTGVNKPSNTTEWIVEAPAYPTSFNNGYAPLPQFSPVNFINGCWSATTTFSTTSIPNKVVTTDASQNGITGSNGICESITAGYSLTALYMYYNNQSPSGVLTAYPSTIYDNFSNFYIYYQQP